MYMARRKQKMSSSINPDELTNILLIVLMIMILVLVVLVCVYAFIKLKNRQKKQKEEIEVNQKTAHSDARKIAKEYIRESIFKTLKNQELYNYGKLGRVDIVVFASSENIDKIKENKGKIELENEMNYYDSLLENYRKKEEEYQIFIDEKEIENSELQLKIDKLEEELEEQTRKIQEYKDQISSIITE